jgi:2'-5' RNA ligase
MRAFFAVDLPDDLADPLADAQAAFEGADGLRFVDPEQAHVTLKFLGEIAETDDDDDTDAPVLGDVIAAGERAFETAAIEPFECSLSGLGVFPSLNYISVVWAGVEAGTRELIALHEALEAETTALGVDPEERAFIPHVTLARMNDARGKELVQRVVHERQSDIGRFEVEEVRLLSSTLTREGPVYDSVATFDLG